MKTRVAALVAALLMTGVGTVGCDEARPHNAQTNKSGKPTPAPTPATASDRS